MSMSAWMAPVVPTRRNVRTPSCASSSMAIEADGPPIPVEVTRTGVCRGRRSRCGTRACWPARGRARRAACAPAPPRGPGRRAAARRPRLRSGRSRCSGDRRCARPCCPPRSARAPGGAPSILEPRVGLERVLQALQVGVARDLDRAATLAGTASATGRRAGGTRGRAGAPPAPPARPSTRRSRGGTSTRRRTRPSARRRRGRPPGRRRTRPRRSAPGRRSCSAQ